MCQGAQGVPRGSEGPRRLAWCPACRATLDKSLVRCDHRASTRRLGSCYYVFTLCAAGAHGPAHLDARIDAFLQTFEETLRRLSPDELEGHRGALIASKTLKDASLADEADRNWEQISGKRCALAVATAPEGCLRPLQLFFSG